MMNDKIDAIATKVMGWEKHIIKDEEHSNLDTRVWSGYDGNNFNPYASWADCGMAIDRMAELGCMFLITGGAKIDSLPPIPKWAVQIEAHEGFTRIKTFRDDDLKTAICEAALKAVVSC